MLQLQFGHLIRIRASSTVECIHYSLECVVKVASVDHLPTTPQQDLAHKTRVLGTATSYRRCEHSH